MDLLDHVAAKIRDLRVNYNSGEGLSQESLAAHLKVATNTISRWETGTYRPSLKDLERISRFFGVPMMSFLPDEMVDDDEDENLKALLRTARQLHPADLEELRKYAEFRRARGIYQGKTRPKPGRKGGKHK
ncbi:MAG TPA: helix-turn-helix transcriptional regulator [Pyrinomonadaceae bacterium]|jgi:transcriptional regulator with XRE-family HTH domain|nr:helix-turn-helix transcriptional regulator [Pyrinomonadaceae bacterium]